MPNPQITTHGAPNRRRSHGNRIKWALLLACIAAGRYCQAEMYRVEVCHG